MHLSIDLFRDASMFYSRDKGDHMADVLLSLKHAVVHPHQVIEQHEHPSYVQSNPSKDTHQNISDTSDSCSFLAALQSSPSNLDLPSSVLGDSFEYSLIGESKDSSAFNFGHISSPERQITSPENTSLVSSPPIFAQLSSMPPFPPISLGNTSPPSNRIETPLASGGSLADREISDDNANSLSYSLNNSLFTNPSQRPASPRSSFTSFTQSSHLSPTSSTIYNSQPSAFTPVVPLPSFVHPRSFLCNQAQETLETPLESTYDHFDPSYGYGTSQDEIAHECLDMGNYSEPDKKYEQLGRSNLEAATSSNMAYTISIDGQPLSSFENLNEKDMSFQSLSENPQFGSATSNRSQESDSLLADDQIPNLSKSYPLDDSQPSSSSLLRTSYEQLAEEVR